MPESLENNHPLENSDQDKSPELAADAGAGPISHVEMIQGDKVEGDKVGGDKITVGRDYVAQQIIIQETAVASIEELRPEAGDAPYKGLQYFTAADTRLFFGREELTTRLVSRLHDTNFLFVVGASGSGKSSIVRAGLIPAFERQERLADGSLPPMGRWQTILLIPTERPLDSLAMALFPEDDQLSQRIEFRARLDGEDTALLDILQTGPEQDPSLRRLLVVDQFEELFTLCKNDPERQRFLANLVAPINHKQPALKTVLILRSDFYTHCLRYEALRPLLEQPTIVGAMSRQELQSAILLPLAAGDWSIQEGLDQLMLDEVGDEPGGLPLLSHALMETWQRRRGRTLTLSGYREAGSVKGAIAKTAETLYTQRLTGSDQQQLAKRVFLELVEPGANERDTRRRISLEQLHVSGSQESEARALLDTLISARLVTADKRDGDQTETYEVAHEALISNWDRLRDWLEDEREQIRFRRQLERDAEEWHDAKGKSDYLYRGSKLARIEEDEGELDAELDPLSREFVAASIAQEESRKRRRNAWLVTAVVVAVVMVVLAVLAFAFAQSSQEQSRLAKANEITANGNALKAETNAQLASDNLKLAEQNARALAIAAQEAQDNAELAISQRRGARTQALSAFSVENQRKDPELAALLALQAAKLNQPGDLSVTWMVDRALRSALNPQDTLYNNVLAHSVPVEQLTFTPDGRQLAARDADKQIVTWDLANLGMPPSTVMGAGQNNGSIAGTCTQNELALVQESGSLRLWNPQQDTFVSFAPPDDSLFWTDVTISNDGRMVAAASDSGPIYVWNTTAPDDPPLRLPSPDNSYAWALTFISNSSTLATAGNDGALRLWSLADPEVDPTLLINTAGSDWRDMAVSTDGRWLAAANDDGRVYLWDLNNPLEENLVIGEHDSGARTVAFSFDGRYLASGGGDSLIHLWEMGEPAAGTIISSTLPGHDQDIRTLAFSCDSRLLASGAGDRMVRLWNLEASPAEPQQMMVPPSAAPDRFNREVTSLQFREADQLLVSAGRDGQVWAWDWQEGIVPPTLLTPDQDNPPTIRTDAQAQRVATVSEDGTLRIKSGDGRTQYLQTNIVQAREEQKGSMLALAADGQSVAVSAGEENTQILFWDLSQDINARPIGEHDDNINQLLFSPDGRTLISASDDGTVRLWPVTSDAGEEIVLRDHKNTVETVAISADGQTLASGDRDHVILIWDLAAPQQPKSRLARHDSDISALAFSEDGRWLASGADDGTLFIWELANLAEPAELVRTQSANIGSLAFSPRGRVLAGGSGFLGEITLWPTLSELVDIGCGVVGRNLTWEEWQRYIPDEPYCPVCPEFEPHQTAIDAGSYDPAFCSPDA